MSMIYTRIVELKDIEQIVPLLMDLDKMHYDQHPDIFDLSKIKPEKRAAFLTENLNNPNSLFIVSLSKSNNTICGFVHCYLHETKNHAIKKDNISAVISDLYVIPSYQNGGVGSLLVQDALKLSKERWSVSSVYLYVYDSNKKAVAFYEKLKFRKELIKYSITI